MLLFSWVGLMVWWFAWLYPFLFRAPHNQQRPSITVVGPTRAGLLLEGLAIFIAFACRIPPSDTAEPLRVAGSLIFGPLAAILSWGSVAHLGRQFRVNAGLYEGHQLVRTGPYAFVRHPIYSSLLCILASTLFLLTAWQWAVLSVALFIAGTEIRVHAEDNLLAGRFPEEFAIYKKEVPAYIPLIR